MLVGMEEIRDKIQQQRVALVHDYLVQDGGAERVFSAFQRIFPKAQPFVLIHNPKHTPPDFKGKHINTSFLNNWPLAKSKYQWYLPLLPLAAEQLDFSNYDLVISSSSSFAKGIIVPPHSTHICYAHTTTRFLWEDRIGYLADLPQPAIVRSILPFYLHSLRSWDRMAAERPDVLLTNSQTSRLRILRHYRRDSQVIYPPADIDQIPLSKHPGDYWLAGGRLVAYKRFDLVVKAFAKLNLPLIVFGVGPELEKLKKMAGKRTKFVGKVHEQEKSRLYRHAIGFINPQVEDFGITTIEAMAAGRPIIAYGLGGAAETVIPGRTGVFIEAQSWEDIGDAVIRHKPADYDPKNIRAHAENFSFNSFQEKILKCVARHTNITSDEPALIGDMYAQYFD